MSIENIFDKKFITILSLIAIGTYLIGLYLLKWMYMCTFNEVILFVAGNLNPVSGMVSLFVFLAGFLLLFVIPGGIVSLHFRKLKEDISVYLGFSFFISFIGLIFVSTLYKIVGGGTLNRISLLGMIVFVIITGLISLWCRPNASSKTKRKAEFNLKRLSPYVLLILLSIIFTAVFSDIILDAKPVQYDYTQKNILAIPLGGQSDDLEMFGLADSLRQHVLPFWDLEYADRFGFAFTDPILYPFISVFTILLFGESKLSLTLISMAFVTITFLIIWGQMQEKKLIHFLVCSALLWAYFFMFLSNTTALIYLSHFFMFLIVSSLCYLLRGKTFMFMVFAMLVTFTQYYGIFFILLGLAGLAIFYKERRAECKGLLRTYGYIVLGLVGSITVIGVGTGNLGVYWETFLVETFMRIDYFDFLDSYFPESILWHPTMSVRGGLQFLWWCLCGTAFTFPMILFFQKNKEENFYAFFILVYFILVFFSRYHYMRYVIIIIPITAIVVSSKLDRWVVSLKKYIR